MRYFFNVHDGKDITDDEGIELPDLDAARTEAIRTSGEMIREVGPDVWCGQDWRMTVTDDAGREVLVLSFSAQVPDLSQSRA
jgi:hypothetical protein